MVCTGTRYLPTVGHVDIYECLTFVPGCFDSALRAR